MQNIVVFCLKPLVNIDKYGRFYYNIIVTNGGNKVKKFTALLVAIVMVFACVSIAACQTENVTVTFNFLNGDSKLVLKFDENFTMPADPVMEGYTFVGWYTDINYTQKWTVPTSLDESVQLYAQWIKADDSTVIPDDGSTTVYVTFNYNYTGAPASETKTCKAGTNVAFPTTPTRQGYSFDGWYTAQTGGTKVTTLAPTQAATTLYAHWTPVSAATVNVTFNYNYNNAPENEVVSVNKGTAVSHSSPAPRSGYTFDGWYTQASGGTEWDFSSAVNADTILYAHWSAEKLFVVFDLQYTRTDATVKEVTAGSNVTFPSNPTRDGYSFAGWYTAPTAGTRVTSYTANANTVLYARWTSTANHEHDFGGNYFAYTTCTVSGCNVIGRNDSNRSFDSGFVYNFNSAKQIEINNHYNLVLESLNNGNDFDEFDDRYHQFYNDLDYVGTQYQIAQTYYDAYCQNTGDVFDKNYDIINEFYTVCEANFYALYQTIYDSSFRSKFYIDWSPAEINEVLASAASVGGSADINNEAYRIAAEYNQLLGQIENSNNPNYSSLYPKFEQFVNANNKLAKQAGYNNYMDYAYENVYYRNYTPAQVASMRSYVKQYIAPLLLKLDKISVADDYLEEGSADEDFYYAIYESLFTTPSDKDYFDYAKNAVNYIADYFKYLVNANGSINFYNAANELFKAGNYYVGASEGAYTYWIPEANKSILYFDNTYDDYYGFSYSTAFTFVHEFGHYYNGVHNGGNEISMDHDETQSQGDEMLFLAWLKQNKPSGVSNGYKLVEIEQLENILSTIVQSTIVDEFEQAVYSNSYGTGKYKNGISSSDYGDLYNEIVSSYGSGMGNIVGDTYWMYVCVDSAAYYISYAMSALPSLEIFVKAQNSTIGLDGAKDIYFKLFTAVKQDNITTYEQALFHAGLDNPFQESLYITLYNYLNTYSI